MVAGLLTDFSVQEALKGSRERLLTLLRFGALHSREDLADAEALAVGCEAEETGPGWGPQGREGHQGVGHSAGCSRLGHRRGAWAGGCGGEKRLTFVRSLWDRGEACGLRSEARFLLQVKCQAWGWRKERGVRGQVSGLQHSGCGWAGCQAPKNLTCDPGRPHRLKGLRDPEAGSMVCGGPTGPPGGGGGGAVCGVGQRERLRELPEMDTQTRGDTRTHNERWRGRGPCADTREARDTAAMRDRQRMDGRVGKSQKEEEEETRNKDGRGSPACSLARSSSQGPCGSPPEPSGVGQGLGGGV